MHFRYKITRGVVVGGYYARSTPAIHWINSLSIKGQMNQTKKIDIYFFVALPSPNTKKNHPK